MFVKALIEISNNTVNALPEETIVQLEGSNYIFVFKGKRMENNQEMNDFKMVEIQKGITENNYT